MENAFNKLFDLFNIYKLNNTSKKNEINTNNIIYKDDVINQIYSNSIKLANNINDALIDNNIVVAIAPMQFGKTDTVHYLSNFLLSKNYEQGETTLFMTSMSDSALLIQNKESLENRKFYFDNKWNDSVTHVVKMVPDFRDNAIDYLKKLNVKVIIFDECDYGSGKNSVFNKNLFKLIKTNKIDVKIVLISATPYCAVNAIFNGELNAKIIQTDTPENYFGVSKMLDLNMIKDINDFDGQGTPYRLLDKFKLTNEFSNDLDWFINENGGGLAIVRAEDKYNANTLKTLIEDYSDKYEVIAVGVRFSSIKSVLGDDSFTWKHSIMHENKKIVLIVINALSAGKDLGSLKNYVRLVIETRKKMIANGSQGLVGRICGYHKNKNIRIIASKNILENYKLLEDNISIIDDQKFIDSINDSGLDFSTQLRKQKKSKTKLKYETIVNGIFKFDDIINKSKELMDNLNNPEFGSYDEFYNTIINNKKSSANSPINTQRSSKYKKNKTIFNIIWGECQNNTIDFGSRFHRFRAEKNDDPRRLRIKRGLIINDETKQFYIVDRIDNGSLIKFNSEVKNESCYNN